MNSCVNKLKTTSGKRPTRTITNEVKYRAVLRVTQDGESKASVARDIGVPESTLRGWCKNSRKIEEMMEKQKLSPETEAEPGTKRIKIEDGTLIQENEAINLSVRSTPSPHHSDSESGNSSSNSSVGTYESYTQINQLNQNSSNDPLKKEQLIKQLCLDNPKAMLEELSKRAKIDPHAQFMYDMYMRTVLCHNMESLANQSKPTTSVQSNDFLNAATAKAPSTSDYVLNQYNNVFYNNAYLTAAANQLALNNSTSVYNYSNNNVNVGAMSSKANDLVSFKTLTNAAYSIQQHFKQKKEAAPKIDYSFASGYMVDALSGTKSSLASAPPQMKTKHQPSPPGGIMAPDYGTQENKQILYHQLTSGSAASYNAVQQQPEQGRVDNHFAMPETVVSNENNLLIVDNQTPQEAQNNIHVETPAENDKVEDLSQQSTVPMSSPEYPDKTPKRKKQLDALLNLGQQFDRPDVSPVTPEELNEAIDHGERLIQILGKHSLPTITAMQLANLNTLVQNLKKGPPHRVNLPRSGRK